MYTVSISNKEIVAVIDHEIFTIFIFLINFWTKIKI